MDAVDLVGGQALLAGECLGLGAEHVEAVFDLVVNEPGKVRGLGGGTEQLVEVGE